MEAEGEGSGGLFRQNISLGHGGPLLEIVISVLRPLPGTLASDFATGFGTQGLLFQINI